MNRIGTKFHIFMALVIVAGVLVQAANPKMKRIFNGKNLNGWVEPENNSWWTAKDGVLSAKSGPERKGSILWTEKTYGNFIFQTDFKMGEGTVDSGIFIRSEDLQIQIGISGSLKRDMTGAPYIPGKGYPIEAEGVDNLLNPDGWNTMKVKAKDNIYTVWLNDQKVMTYKSEHTNDKGPIGLQLHPGNEMTIDFRNMMVAEL